MRRRLRLLRVSARTPWLRPRRRRAPVSLHLLSSARCFFSRGLKKRLRPKNRLGGVGGESCGGVSVSPSSPYPGRIGRLTPGTTRKLAACADRATYREAGPRDGPCYVRSTTRFLSLPEHVFFSLTSRKVRLPPTPSLVTAYVVTFVSLAFIDMCPGKRRRVRCLGRLPLPTHAPHPPSIVRFWRHLPPPRSPHFSHFILTNLPLFRRVLCSSFFRVSENPNHPPQLVQHFKHVQQMLGVKGDAGGGRTREDRGRQQQ